MLGRRTLAILNAKVLMTLTSFCEGGRHKDLYSLLA